eukprot:365482-Chlamydomonas_euryale.AAC.17
MRPLRPCMPTSSSCLPHPSPLRTPPVFGGSPGCAQLTVSAWRLESVAADLAAVGRPQRMRRPRELHAERVCAVHT